LREIFEEEYKKIEKSLFLVALGYLHNTEDARDAVQEAVLAAYRSFSGLRHREYFKTWMTRIVINKCKDFLRKQKYTEELTDTISAFCELPAQELELVDAICRLDPRAAAYITLRFYHGMTYEEVARMMHQTVSTVKYRTRSALDALKSILEGDTQ